ncbi:PhzF family phenazine biosynthesis protein [Acetanaerobacterium elongatum]|uniref:Phenazine biosynthesis protein PhzF family n=1 Tax=Acetanaerobacterium elongatum TaxID=258515 RepID=A0A1H0A8L2_9FIRM|nr:PhzF family phenazine biosynthesis isomerase [Acetanaerobacterium elongatum]SDN29999.1 phenazine biosynthesis protein PhzF family [Acetanaerobacterium elongatum]
MREYPYKKVDAFTSAGSLGNPAACIYLKEDQQLTHEEMLSIAVAHKYFVSEMVYCSETPSGIHLTYYSSESEVPFCGHGTIACMHSLIKNSPRLIQKPEIEIQTNLQGSLTVYNRIKEQDAVYITAPQPEYSEVAISAELAAARLGIRKEELNPQLPIKVVGAGMKTLIVPILSLATEIAITPDFEPLKQLCEENKIDIVLIFSLETAAPEFIAHTRVFPPRYGYLEDPATGSGNSAFGYYMLRQGLWNGEAAAVEQGAAGVIYNTVRLATLNNRVLFGGGAAERISGVYYL